MEKIIASANSNLQELSQYELASVGGGNFQPPVNTLSSKLVFILNELRPLSQPDDIVFL